MEKWFHARQLRTLFIQELCPTQFQKNTRWLSVYSTIRSLRVKEKSVWGKAHAHLQRPPSAEQPSGSAALSFPQPGQAISAARTVPSSDLTSLALNTLPSLSETRECCPDWWPRPQFEHLHSSPLGPSDNSHLTYNSPPASTKEEPRYPLCCPTGLWRLAPPPWDIPDYAVPTYSLASFRVSIRTSPTSNHFVTH